MLTLVGEIARSELKTYQDRRTRRPAYRLETVLQTDGPRLKMTFFAKNQGTAGWHARRLGVGPPRRLRRAGQHLPRRVAADQPEDGAVRYRQRRGGRGGRGRRQLRRPLPDLPADQGRGVVGHPARGQLRPLGDRRGARAGPRRHPGQVRRGRRAQGRRPDPRARQLRPGRGRPPSLPLRGGAGHPGRARPAAGVPPHPGRAGPHRRRRPAGGVRRAAAVRADRRAARDRRGRSRPTSPSRTR